jgi:hypothetical protein
MPSGRTNAHLPGVALFLQMSGLEWRHPRVSVSVSAGVNGLLWSGRFCDALPVMRMPFVVPLAALEMPQLRTLGQRAANDPPATPHSATTT